MDVLARAWQYAAAHDGELLEALGQHLLLAGIALGVGCLVCAPLGVLTSRSRVASAVLVNAFSAVRVVPSLAVLFLAIPYFGLTTTSALLALTVLALPPILINSDAAFRTIDPAVREAAAGMGMTNAQVLRRVEIPLALPTVIAGIRTAAVEVVSSATLAAFIGAGGLGVFVVRGFALYDVAILLTGAVPVALLAIAAEAGLGAVERTLRPPAG
jgi:osmoprotectant transport system permease protein